MICTDGRVQQYNSIIASMSIDYKEQVMITDIKLGMQWSMYQVPPEKCENLCKTWVLRIYEST